MSVVFVSYRRETRGTKYSIGTRSGHKAPLELCEPRHDPQWMASNVEAAAGASSDDPEHFQNCAFKQNGKS